MMKNITVKTYNSIAKKYQKMFQNDFSEKKYYDKFDILGIDFSDEMLKIAKNRYPDISFLKMDITDIQLNEKYNGIVCANSLFHIKKSDIIKVLNKCYELLVPEGKILFIILN
jgi:ubiquinone/menaquinone biosynthesis C-methylase UbiE